MLKLAILQRNSDENSVRNLAYPTSNLSAQLAFRISALWAFALASALLYVVEWTSGLRLDCDEVVLPYAD